MMTNEVVAPFAIFVITWVLTVLATAFAPYFIRKTIAFGIAVPEAEYHAPFLSGLRKAYAVICVAVGLLLAVVTLFSLWNRDPETTAFLFAGGMLIYIAIATVLYFWFYAKVKLYKDEQNWPIDTVAVASLTQGPEEKKVISSGWYLLYLILVMITVSVTMMVYPSLPEQVPMNYNFSGEVTNYGSKSQGVLFIMPVFQLMMTLLFAGTNFGIISSKRQGNLQKDSVFRSVMSRSMFILGFGVVALLMIAQFSMIGFVSIEVAIVFIVLFLIANVLYVIYISLKVGQGGSRLKGPDGKGANVAEDDTNWILGMFYCNKDDPSVFVEKRFGIGYTVNLGRPFGVFAIILLAVLIVAGLTIPFIFKG